MNRVVCLMVVMAVAMSVASASSCSTFCKDPYLNIQGEYVCCDKNPGTCPERDECPPLAQEDVRQGIRFCHYDPECHPNEKCCFDICIKQKVCKLADP
ncbi:uncharacterized protein LOC123507557 isoform X2 [Portunus trituberculatus]|uniref:uncharacterized protein LOC123507557 isoform X2 n=1 Tax=Portunus trituberculatus TaxID=210409 RepID=UPI001E1CF4A9|nr:uncharacterized protein LOC123507557 isoform X2 [Portunus trituberculatus]